MRHSVSVDETLWSLLEARIPEVQSDTAWTSKRAPTPADVARFILERGLLIPEDSFRLVPGKTDRYYEHPETKAACNGDKIEAIKAFRQVTGLGLKEAKEAIELLRPNEVFKVLGNPGLSYQILDRGQVCYINNVSTRKGTT